MVGKLEGLSEEDLLKIIENRPELKEQIMPTAEKRPSGKPLPKISDKKPRRKRSAKVVTQKEIQESFGEQARKQIAEQLGKVNKSDNIKPNDDTITVDADTKKPKRVNTKKLVKQQLKDKKVPKAFGNKEDDKERDSRLNPLSSYLISSFEKNNPMLSKLIDFIFKDKSKQPKQSKQEHMQTSSSATAVRQSGILNDNLNNIKDNQQNTIDILTRIENSLSEVLKRSSSQSENSGGILNTVLDALSGAAGRRLLMNVLRAAPLVATAAAVGAGLWRARNTESGRADFEESEGALQQTARAQQNVAEPIGDIPPPSSMIQSSEDEVKQTLISYGLSDSDAKFKQWMEEWKKLQTNPTPVSSPVTNPVNLASPQPLPVSSSNISPAINPVRQISQSENTQVNAPSPLLRRASSVQAPPPQPKDSNVIEFKAKEIVFSADTIDFSQKNMPSAEVASFQRTSFASGVRPPPQAPQATQQNRPPSAGPTPGPESGPAGLETDNQNLSGGQLSLPVNAKVTSPYGQRSSGMHPGIDFGVPEGTPIRSSQSGIVTRLDNEAKGYGNWVEVTDQTTGIATRYAHLSKPAVGFGQQVSAGDVVGLSGNTGRSTGPHLHFEVLKDGKKVDPTSYISGAKEVPEGQQKDNEAAGAASAVQLGPEVADPNLAPPPGSSGGEGGGTMVPSTPKIGDDMAAASKENEFSKREDAIPKSPELISPEQSSPPPGAPDSGNSIDPNEPGNLEPEDSMTRYNKLFGLSMAA